MSAHDGDVEGAAEVLASARGTESLLRELRSAADEGLSVITSSPFKRHHKPGVRKMVDLVEPLDRAMRSTRVLVRRVTVAVGRGESLPPGYEALLLELAAATDVIARALSENASPEIGRRPCCWSRRRRGRCRAPEPRDRDRLAQIRSTWWTCSR